MCGISGIWRRDGGVVRAEELRRMNLAQRHRGPDGAGWRVEGAFGMAHTRLALVDPSETADQPLADPSGRFWITFNGEVHNFPELRSELDRKGHRFRSAGDTEVVLTAFREWATGCFHRYNGMWALAVWDAERRRLVLCRDRFGQKPLYWAAVDDTFVFASEVKAILAVFPELAEPDLHELGQFLQGSSPDSGATTFYRKIRAVPPGCWIEVSGDVVGEPQSYWDFEPGTVGSGEGSAEEFLGLLTDAVRIRLRSDFPIGLCVSGGLDSGAVASLARRLTPLADRDIHCFSLAYPEDGSVDESSYAQQVVDHVGGLKIHWVHPSNGELVERVASSVKGTDAPTPLRGRLPMWAMFEEASKQVKSVLIGEGSDELLGGYPRFALPWLLDRLRSDPLRTLPGGRTFREFAHLTRLVEAGGVRRMIEVGAPILRRFSWRPEPSCLVLTRDYRASLASPDPRLLTANFFDGRVPRVFESRLNHALWHDFRFAGLPELLRAEDALGMAHSVETRAPFLDHRVVEFCFRLPFQAKIDEGWTKLLLRRSTNGILPEPVRWRLDKKGMPAPYLAWFQDPANFAPVREALLDGKLIRCGLLDPKALESMLRAFCQGRTAGLHLLSIWRLLTSELWFGGLNGSYKKPGPRAE